MKRKKYKAAEMRDMAEQILECDDDWYYEAAHMLCHAADMLGREEKREKKYEYTVKYSNGRVSLLHYEFIDPLKLFVDEHNRLVRREVGEWEEVK